MFLNIIYCDLFKNAEVFTAGICVHVCISNEIPSGWNKSLWAFDTKYPEALFLKCVLYVLIKQLKRPIKKGLTWHFIGKASTLQANILPVHFQPTKVLKRTTWAQHMAFTKWIIKVHTTDKVEKKKKWHSIFLC